MFGQRETALFDLDRIGAVWERLARFEQFFARHGKEANAVKEAQEPWLLEARGRMPAVPHLDRAAEELIAAGSFHAIDAEIGAADPDRVFRRPRAGGVVLCRDQTMARIERRR